MPGIGKNIIANVAGKGFIALTTLIFVPLYVRFLGVEAFGLIGFFTTLQTVFLLADFGLSATLTRETARNSTAARSRDELRDFCRTFEFISYGVGLGAAIVILLGSHAITERWVKPEQLSLATIDTSVRLMGLTIGLQFPFFLYQGGLLGLQRQISLNALTSAIALLRGVGAVLLLIAVAPTIEVFFVWQAIASIVQLAIARTLVWRNLRSTLRRPRFNIALIQPVWRFTSGMAAIAVTSIVLTQIDKIVLSKMLSLEAFGYYSLAGIVAGVPYLLAAPINNAVYPRLTQLVANDDIAGVTRLYHRSCQLIAALAIPLGLVVAAFSHDLLLMWTGSATTAHYAAPLASVLVIGSTLLGLMYIPYALQLAFAWTSLSLRVNIFAIALLIPALIWLTSAWGAIGACIVWVALNLGYVLVTIQLMHRRLLQGEKWSWYCDDFLKPLIAALLVVAIARLLLQGTLSWYLTLAYIGVTYLTAILASAISAPLIRGAIITGMSVALRE